MSFRNEMVFASDREALGWLVDELTERFPDSSTRFTVKTTYLDNKEREQTAEFKSFGFEELDVLFAFTSCIYHFTRISVYCAGTNKIIFTIARDWGKHSTTWLLLPNSKASVFDGNGVVIRYFDHAH